MALKKSKASLKSLIDLVKNNQVNKLKRSNGEQIVKYPNFGNDVIPSEIMAVIDAFYEDDVYFESSEYGDWRDSLSKETPVWCKAWDESDSKYAYVMVVDYYESEYDFFNEGYQEYQTICGHGYENAVPVEGKLLKMLRG